MSSDNIAIDANNSALALKYTDETQNVIFSRRLQKTLALATRKYSTILKLFIKLSIRVYFILGSVFRSRYIIQ